MGDTLSRELARAEEWLAKRFTETMARYTQAFPHSPATAVALVRSYLVAAACSAITEDVALEGFLETARHAYRFALEQTREVDAEDGN